MAEELLLVPVDETIVFPDMTVSLPIDDVAVGERVLLVPRDDDGAYGNVGTIAEVTELARLPRGHSAAVLTADVRGVPGVARTGPDGRLYVPVEPHPDENPPRAKTAEAEREYRAIVEEIIEIRGIDARVSAFVRSITAAGTLADTAGYSPDLSHEQKVRILEALDVEERLAIAIELQREVLAELQVRRRIRDDIQDETQKQQRDYFLRKQMDSIRKELGDDDASVVEEYRSKLEEGGVAEAMPEAVREQFERELARLDRMGDGGMESQTIRSYLDWLLAVPWGEVTPDELDITRARQVLDDEHAGLEDVKERIIEHLAVRKLRIEREIEADPRSGAILTLIGPPGTGKTSIGESIAHALGRKFVRLSLGGMRDEAEIRGHRRTYVGALPGRLVRALRDAGTMNPVILLDEVDKVGADWRGDPSSALLEVLDPAQNHTFRDHYLDVELDLSQVFFIATANVAEQIPGPLLDRMEVIPFDGYTVDEKVAIGRDHLWPRQRDRAGLQSGEVELLDEAVRAVVTEYTRESGVRQLDRALATVARKTATRIVTDAAGGSPTTDDATGESTGASVPTVLSIGPDAARDALGKRRVWQESAERTAVPGVATGLAVTGTGGDVLFVEATSMPSAGSGGGGELVLTGQLGDVMRESARIALSHVRANADRFGIEPDAFEGRTFHLHVPAGAIPKDGPSAGITMATALVSLLTGRPVRHTVGMTGELTLQGKVLPIGGLKQKVLAAHAAGLTEVVLPERNRADLDDVPDDVREAMSFQPTMLLHEVIERALETQPVADVPPHLHAG